ncbi:MAG: bifunctional (p)ppGpp synthetase/guanosine-3',5'-bis(diphosphate) 3'-pyrophosphohydrolase, partial [Clostridia bacterium]|nr:bifunctional (p)ppGpp synthetase/guanosine-3',5'-bis(diphosphate) 3'-pyrophosphohydrolase [Clostridia bacterium]
TWLREVMEWEGDLKDSKEFVNALKTELYSHELLVFTPRGKVVSLPPEATPVDFAYAIHTEVGNRCTGARVNAKIVPLHTTLEVGDVVEIITSANSKGPSRDWLKFVKSSSARAKIKQFYKNLLREDYINKGKEELAAEAKKKGYEIAYLLDEDAFKRIADRFAFSTMDEMYAAVGYGSISVYQILVKLVDYYKRKAPPTVQVTEEKSRGARGGVLINGEDGLLVSFAGCCSPVRGDEIVGYTSRGRGVVVHRADCPNLKHIHKERILPAAWDVSVSQTQRYNAHIVIRALDQGAAISVLSAVTSEMKLSITSINGRNDKSGDAIVETTVSLADVTSLDILFKKLLSDKRVYDVHRVTSLS